MANNVRVKITDRDGLDAWRADLPRGEAFMAAVKAKIAATGATVLCWQGDGPRSFMWMCPGCGNTYSCPLGSEPVSGWDNPVWVNSGTLQRPTLTPSLGCGGWRRGDCDGGHYWLRDGELADA